MRIPHAALPLFALLTVAPTLVAQVPGGGGRGPADIRTADLDSMSQSDPFILADPITRMYYMTGSGWRHMAELGPPDLGRPLPGGRAEPGLVDGSQPLDLGGRAALLQGRYYYFATFTNRDSIIDIVPDRYDVQRRASHVLMSENVMGPYRPMNDQCPRTGPRSTERSGSKTVCPT